MSGSFISPLFLLALLSFFSSLFVLRPGAWQLLAGGYFAEVRNVTPGIPEMIEVCSSYLRFVPPASFSILVCFLRGRCLDFRF